VVVVLRISPVSVTTSFVVLRMLLVLIAVVRAVRSTVPSVPRFNPGMAPVD
jgi:hypothetical protein